MRQEKKYSAVKTLLKKLAFLGCFLIVFGSAHGQAITDVTTAYELGSTTTGDSKLHVFFVLEGASQVVAIEVLIGSTQGIGDVMKVDFQVQQKQGNYILIGPFGETVIEGNKAHVQLPIGQDNGGKANFVSLATITTSQVKSGYAFGEIQK